MFQSENLIETKNSYKFVYLFLLGLLLKINIFINIIINSNSRHWIGRHHGDRWLLWLRPLNPLPVQLLLQPQQPGDLKVHHQATGVRLHG